MKGRLDVVEKEILTVQQSFQTILKCIADEKADMKQEKEKLEMERQSFELMKKRIEDVNKNKANKVRLNIGGVVFDTSAETLTCEEGSMLEAMFSGRFKIEREDDGSCFIDRDSTYFPIILSYLRDKRDNASSLANKYPAPIKLSVDPGIAEKVLKEAEFYGLDGLQHLIMVSTSLVVGQDGSAKYPTINAALRDARDGDRILVRPGMYFESLVLEKDVDIVADGSYKDVTLCYSGDHVVTSMSEKGRIQGISIQQQGDEYHCLFITKGCLLVEECEFQSCGWACVGISGEKTYPILRSNTIASSADNGIIILSKGKGIIEGNEVCGYTLQGIEIREESNPIIKNNRIHGGNDSGIYVNTKGRGIIEGNEIYDNAFNGIAIKFEGQPKKVSGNKIWGNRQRGIYISGDSMADLEDNDVHDNAGGDVIGE